jgi:photosystem II stability/assembly factor-like uncharacterized protein
MNQPRAWERLALRSGGTIAALAGAVDSDGSSVVFAATPAGVHRSVDHGRTWAPAGPTTPVPFAEAVAVSPGFIRDRTIMVGGGEGAYRSTDAGQTWQRVLVGSRALSLAVARDSGQRDTWLVGTDSYGILRSEDAGRTWAGANPGLVDLTVLALALSPAFEQDRIGFAGSASGLYRTRNGAQAWRAVDTGLDDPPVQCLAISPRFAEDRLVLAGTEADGLLRSVDAGTTWEIVPSLGRRGVAALAIGRVRGGGHPIAAATDEGVAVSHDGGRAWRMTGPELGPVLSLLFVPLGETDRLLAGVARQGVIAWSDDYGTTWQRTSEGLSASLLTSLAVSPGVAQDGILLVAGPEEGVSVSADGGRTWLQRNEGLDGAAVMDVVVSSAYARDRTIYAATTSGLLRSCDQGATWERTSAPPELTRLVRSGPDPGEGSPAVVVAGTGGLLLQSDDAGRTWRTLRQGFEWCEIVSLALSSSYARDGTLFVGTSAVADGSGERVLWRSTDHGARWERWLVEPGSGVLPVAVPASHATDEMVFVGLDRRVLSPMRHAREVRAGERRPIWRGVEPGGGTALVTALGVSPAYATDRTVFAATSAGVFVSRSGGDTFEPWSDGLQPLSVVALAVSPNYAVDRLVYAITIGGGIWQRRDPE